MRRNSLILWRLSGLVIGIAVEGLEAQTVTATIDIGDGPLDVAFAPGGQVAYVTINFENKVKVIEAATHTVIDEIGVGWHPFSVAFAPDGQRACVANDDGTVSVIGVATATVTGAIAVGGRPQRAAFVSATTAFVSVPWKSR